MLLSICPQFAAEKVNTVFLHFQNKNATGPIEAEVWQLEKSDLPKLRQIHRGWLQLLPEKFKENSKEFGPKSKTDYNITEKNGKKTYCMTVKDSGGRKKVIAYLNGEHSDNTFYIRFLELAAQLHRTSKNPVQGRFFGITEGFLDTIAKDAKRLVALMWMPLTENLNRYFRRLIVKYGLQIDTLNKFRKNRETDLEPNVVKELIEAYRQKQKSVSVNSKATREAAVQVSRLQESVQIA